MKFHFRGKIFCQRYQLNFILIVMHAQKTLQNWLISHFCSAKNPKNQPSVILKKINSFLEPQRNSLKCIRRTKFWDYVFCHFWRVLGHLTKYISALCSQGLKFSSMKNLYLKIIWDFETRIQNKFCQLRCKYVWLLRY